MEVGETAVIVILLLLANYFSLRQRTLTLSEVYLLWFPLGLAIMYSWIRFKRLLKVNV